MYTLLKRLSMKPNSVPTHFRVTFDYHNAALGIDVCDHDDDELAAFTFPGIGRVRVRVIWL